MNIDWRLKRDPKQHPVRFLAGIWQERMSVNFGVTRTQLAPKEMGQLKLLRKALGELTPDVVKWMLGSVNWWHFCQQVRVESGLHHVPPHPHIGFLLAHYPVGLRVMRSRLSNSNTGADFVSRFDQVRYEQMRTLVSVLADGIPERLAQIEAAKTLRDIQRVFIAIVDDNTVAPAKHSTLQPEALHQAQKLPLHQRDGQETQV